MDLGLIERLNALKLHGADATANANQRDADQYARLAAQLQEQYERQLAEQQQRLQHELQLMQRRVDALERQNELLRSAVGAADTYKAQVADQQLQIETLQDQVKQLRLTNYRLQFMVQQNDRVGGANQFLPPPPPDIF